MVLNVPHKLMLTGTLALHHKYKSYNKKKSTFTKCTITIKHIQNIYKYKFINKTTYLSQLLTFKLKLAIFGILLISMRVGRQKFLSQSLEL